VGTIIPKIRPTAIRYNAIDDSFFRTCNYDPDTGALTDYGYMAMDLRPSSNGLIQPATTSLKYAQVKNYGASVSADGTTLFIRNWTGSLAGSLAFVITNPNAVGTIELRYAGTQPNFTIRASGDVSLLNYEDIAESGAVGGWGMVKVGPVEQSARPPLMSAAISNGKFRIVSNLIVFHSICELWTH
jgi:hypothetical protein